MALDYLNYRLKIQMESLFNQFYAQQMIQSLGNEIRKNFNDSFDFKYMHWILLFRLSNSFIFIYFFFFALLSNITFNM